MNSFAVIFDNHDASNWKITVRMVLEGGLGGFMRTFTIHDHSYILPCIFCSCFLTIIRSSIPKGWSCVLIRWIWLQNQALELASPEAAAFLFLD